MKIKACAVVGALCLCSPGGTFAQVTNPEPTRIVVECEDMKGVDQEHFGPGSGWQVGRWGHDLYQNNTFGGAWSSRLRNAMTDEGNNSAEAIQDIDVPVDGTYMVWAKYECPPNFNYAFGVRLEESRGKVVYEKTYGLRESAKHFSFKSQLLTGDLYWNWGLDHDAAEGYPVTLQKGRYHLILSKKTNPVPAGARSVDVIMLTTDPSPVSAPRFTRFPLLDELRRANHVYFRFRNTGSAPMKISWTHYNHRAPDYYYPMNTDKICFYDENGQSLGTRKNGDWTNAIAPGAISPWFDLGPTMNVESTSPYQFSANPPGAKPAKDSKSMPFAVDLALEPVASKILKSFELPRGEPALGVLVQPDLHRKEGVAFTRSTLEIYQELTRALNAEPRLGPVPRKLKLFAQTEGPLSGDDMSAAALDFREALGINTLPINSPKSIPAVLARHKPETPVVTRSEIFLHSTDIPTMIKYVKDNKMEDNFYYLSFGDEIGLPAIDVKDTAKVAEFRELLKHEGETPKTLGVSAWDQVKPLPSLSPAVAVQIGVLPAGSGNGGISAELKRLYWYSQRFQVELGIRTFAEKTKTFREALGPEVHTAANLGSMMPFFWMHQATFIEAFKKNAMSLAWSEDYTYCQPEASRLVADFEVAYLRKGASYHDTTMKFYCMPHWPGNTPECLIQNAVLEWGQGVKDLDFYQINPDIWATENYVAYRGGLPTLKAVRTLSSMAGLVEDHLLPARVEPARIAMLLSESSDLWETEGKGQGAVEPGSEATNVSQEERKAIWYALRRAGYRVDVVTEEDCSEGLLKQYRVLYVCGQNLEAKAAQAVEKWVKAGGVVFATAGAARFDEFDAPTKALDKLFGRGGQVSYQHYKGPLRARLELIWQKPLDQVTLASGGTVNALCSREEFEASKDAKVLGSYKNGKPALIEHTYGKGRAIYAGLLPGQAYLQPGMPVMPQGKSGAQSSRWMIEPMTWDATAAGIILSPVTAAGVQPDTIVSAPGVVINRLKSEKSTVLTVVNLGQQVNGDLKDVEIRVTDAGSVKRAWSCYYPKGISLVKNEAGEVVVKLPTLATVDIIVLER
ncbi:MAG: beta-galactosidase trimerization domain-containing protein [bacterium]